MTDSKDVPIKKIAFKFYIRWTIQKMLAAGTELTGVNWLSHRLQTAWFSPFVRIVNYHDVPPSKAANFERQLQFYQRRFVAATREDLLNLHAGRWPHNRPGLIITFDDGLKSQAEVAAPLLEKYGFAGWFFISTGLVDTPREQQRGYAYDHHIHWSQTPGDDLGVMSWEDIQRLDQRHVIGCHTQSHVRLSSNLSAEQLDYEIPQAKRLMEQRLGHEVDAFCWVGGEEWSYSANAAQAIRDAGFRFSFLNGRFVVRPHEDLLQLQRNCVEPHHEPFLVRFLFCGLLDALSIGVRKRVKAVVGEPEASSVASLP